MQWFWLRFFASIQIGNNWNLDNFEPYSPWTWNIPTYLSFLHVVGLRDKKPRQPRVKFELQINNNDFGINLFPRRPVFLLAKSGNATTRVRSVCWLHSIHGHGSFISGCLISVADEMNSSTGRRDSRSHKYPPPGLGRERAPFPSWLRGGADSAPGQARGGDPQEHN